MTTTAGKGQGAKKSGTSSKGLGEDIDEKPDDGWTSFVENFAGNFSGDFEMIRVKLVESLSYRNTTITEYGALVRTLRAIESPKTETGKFGKFAPKDSSGRKIWKVAGSAMPDLISSKATQDAWKDHVEKVIVDAFSHSDKSQVSWIIAASNPFWRVWKGQVAKAFAPASAKLLLSLGSKPEKAKYAAYRDLRNLSVITLFCMIELNKAESMSNLKLLPLTIPLYGSTIKAVTMPFFQWIVFCSQALGRCGLWKELSLTLGTQNLKTSLLGSDNDVYAIHYLFTDKLGVRCVPSNVASKENYLKAKAHYEKVVDKTGPDGAIKELTVEFVNTFDQAEREQFIKIVGLTNREKENIDKLSEFDASSAKLTETEEAMLEEMAFKSTSTKRTSSVEMTLKLVLWEVVKKKAQIDIPAAYSLMEAIEAKSRYISNYIDLI